MTTLYVSYKSIEEPFVRDVVSRLAPKHDIRIDYHIPGGADWRAHQLAELRSSEVFLVFVSRETLHSDFQNAEMGSARFCSVFLDGKLILPVLIDNVDPPRVLADLDCLNLSDRDPARAAREIDEHIARRTKRARLFVSHAHRDVDLAKRLVDVLVSHFDVPDGALLCTSVPGYQLELGTTAADALRKRLGSSICVLALLTPHSLANEWVLFELGASWANATLSVPLLAGGLHDSDIPGALRGAAGGQLGNPNTLARMLAQLEETMGWPRRSNGLASVGKYNELVDYVRTKTFADQRISADIRIDETDPRVGQRMQLSGIGPPEQDIWLVIHPQNDAGYYVQPRAQSDASGRWTTPISFGEPRRGDHHVHYELRAFARTDRGSFREDERLASWPTARISSVSRMFLRDRD